MRKILLGISVLASLAFLAACGGDGSSGSAGSDGTGTTGTTGATGTTGDTGATGADGTIAVPSADSDLALSLNQQDMDSDILDYEATINVAGLDNLTVDSRQRYYTYQGTSATAKAGILSTATAVTTSPKYAQSGVIDSRLKASDNLSLAFTGNAEIASSSITHMIVCPGNEAGDATSCASIAIRDRAAHGAVTLAGLTTDTNVSIAYGNSAFQVLSDNRSAADNGSIGYRIGSDTKANAYAGTAQSADNTSTALSGLGNALVVSNVTFKGNNAFFATSDNTSNSDNLTIFVRSSGAGDYSIDNETNIAEGTHTVLQIDSDGTDIFIVQDNGTGDGLVGHVFLDNETILNSAEMPISTNQMCSTATTDKMIIVVDNGSAVAGFDVFTLHDNGTMAATATDSTVTGLATILSCDLTISSSTYILTLLEDGGDNITVLSSDNLTGWSSVYETATGQSSSVKVSASAPNGTGDVWVALDDGSNVDLYHSDNGTSGGLALVHTISTANLGGIAHDGGAAGAAKIGIAVDNSTDAKVDVYYE